MLINSRFRNPFVFLIFIICIFQFVLSGGVFAQTGNSDTAPSSALQNDAKRIAPLSEPGELDPAYFSSNPPRLLTPEELANQKRWGDYYNLRKSQGASVAPLEVPYYSQGSSLWCWAAALSMISGYHGFSDRIWDIASYFEIETDGIKFLYRNLSDYLHSKHDVFAEYDTYYDVEALNGYIMQALDHNTPAWVAILTVRHVVVAVGYDKNHIYIHDPAGLLIGHAEKLKGEESSWRDTLKGKLAAYPIPWEHWNNALRTSPAKDFIVTKAFRTVQPVAKILTIVSPVSPHSKPLSIQITPAGKVAERRSLNVAHFIRRASDHQIVQSGNVEFEWTGKKPGVRIFHDSKITIPEPAACNDDRLLSVRVFVSNSSAVKRTFGAQVFFDGGLLGKIEGTIEPRTNDKPFDIRKSESRTEKVIDPETKLTISITRKIDYLKAFDETPVTPGMHVLRFDLLEKTTVVDSIKVPFPVAPAEVKNVSVKWVDKDHIRLNWRANSEPGVYYRVVSTPGMNLNGAKIYGTTKAVQLTVQLSADNKKETERFFSVWAYDEKSGLQSQMADFRKIEGKVIPPPPPPAPPVVAEGGEAPDPVVRMTPEQLKELRSLSYGLRDKKTAPTSAANYEQRLAFVQMAFRSFQPADRKALFGKISWAGVLKEIAAIRKESGVAATYGLVDRLLIRFQTMLH